jgi:hypothetical protein
MLGGNFSSGLKLAPVALALLCGNAFAQSHSPGWLSTRDQNPFVLATGLPLAPAVPDAGTWQVDTTLSIANTEMELRRDQTSILFDAETRETRFGVAYGFGGGWSLRGSLAHFHVGAGFLDGPVEEFHRLFGLSNGDRGLLGSQAPVVEVRVDDELRYALASPGSDNGPLLIDLAHQWRFDGERSMGLMLGAKFPVGHADRLADSESTDLSLTAFGAMPVGRNGLLAARIGVLRQGDNELLDDLARRSVPFASFLIRYRLGERWSAVLQSDAHGPLYRRLPDFLGRTGNLISVGLARRIGQHAEFQATLGEDLPALHSTDIEFNLNLRVFPGRH